MGYSVVCDVYFMLLLPFFWIYSCWSLNWAGWTNGSRNHKRKFYMTRIFLDEGDIGGYDEEEDNSDPGAVECDIETGEASVERIDTITSEFNSNNFEIPSIKIHDERGAILFEEETMF